MYEVELKVRASHAQVRRRLIELGAREGEPIQQRDVYYRAPHRSFATTDEALRLRHEEGTHTSRQLLTYKGPRIDARSKTRVEYEVEVGDTAAMDAALQALGFEPATRVVKRRTSFEHRGYRIALDSVEGLGEFVEVERAAREAERERVLEGGRRLLVELGLDPDDQIRMSYLELLPGT